MTVKTKRNQSKGVRSDNIISPFSMERSRCEGMNQRKNLQLFIQTEAVAIAAPLLLIESGNISLGKIHAIGP